MGTNNWLAGSPGGNLGPSGAAISFVEQGWNFFEDKATRFSDMAIALIKDLSYVPNVRPIEWNVTFPDIAPLVAFVAPKAPTLPSISFTPVAIPEAPLPPQVPVPVSTEAPAFDVAPPAPITLPVQPGDFTDAAPAPISDLDALVVPDLPGLPALPARAVIDIPLLEALPVFAGHDPGDAPRLPDLSGVGFTEQAYTPAVLNDMLPVIRSGLAGNNVLSASIEQALFQRARERINRVALQAMQAIDEDFTSRGFKLPPGARRAANKEALRTMLDTSADTNRDLTTQQHKEALESVKFAVTQGIALEQVLIAQHGQIMDRSLQSARLLLDTHVALFNADVAGYNAKVERYKAEAAVFESRITAIIEGFKAKIAGAQAQADISKAEIDAFVAQVQGLSEQYRASVASVQAQADIQRARIENNRAQVEAFSARVDAYGKKWDGYRAAVDAQQSGFRSYEIGVNAYAARVNAWSAGEQAKSTRYDIQTKGAQLTLDAYRARLQGVLAQLQGEETRIRALGTQSESLSRMYAAAGQIEQARADANTRAVQAATAFGEARANVQLREAEIKIQDAQRMLAAQIEAMRGASAALSQLAASAMTAVNFSAAVSGSGSESESWAYSLAKGINWGYSGEMPDGNGPPVF